jgi:protein-L-isoaspartate O-methyltransferase
MDAPRVSAEAIAAAAAASPLHRALVLSDLADRDELRFREEIEGYPDPPADVPRFIEGKQLPGRLAYALERARLEPAGTVVELGAGVCWLAGALAARPAVERVHAVEFSERRLTELAPIALAHLGAPAAKVERRLADFYASGLPDGCADWVFMDAAFHHAPDPVRLAGVAFALLRPGGRLVLFREPTLSLLRRSRDHGTEALHGDFEREYDARGYERALRAAGFAPVTRHPAAGGFATPRQRAILRPPLSWLNGIAFAEWTYVGVRGGR